MRIEPPYRAPKHGVKKSAWTQRHLKTLLKSATSQTSYRDLLPQTLSEMDKSSLYLDFLKECLYASDDTKRKFKKRLGLGGML